MNRNNVSALQVSLLLLQVFMIAPAAKAQYTHPGGLHTSADLNRMKTEVAASAHPWIDDWNLLIVDPLASSTYADHATGNMGSNRQNADEDAHAAYLNALECYIKGTTANCSEASKILNDWSAAVNVVPSGNNTPGLVAIPIMDLNLAAEVQRTYSGWTSANITAFKNMNTNYLYPVVNTFLTTHNGTCASHYWTNWDAANIGALVAMGVFNDDTSYFNQGVAYYESGSGMGAVNNAVWTLYSGGLGQWEEAGRDQEHDQLGVGELGYAATVAYNQGVDLFNYNSNRLLAGAEYTAQYNQNLSVPYTTFNNCDSPSVDQTWISRNGRDRLDDRPVWELIYNHYDVLKGVSTPNSKQMALLERPDHGSTDHFGYGTLTFTLNATDSPLVTAAPATPSAPSAWQGVGHVDLGWSTVGTANGYNVLRSTSSGGSYSTIASLTASTLTQYTDTTVTNGTTYYYKVQAINQAGTSGSSGASSGATPQAAGSLPSGWGDSNINSSGGSATYSSENANSFPVDGEGTGIGGTADSFNYAYKQVTGNYTFTARLDTITGADLNHAGIMMRNSLNDNDMSVSMVLGSTGWRIAAMGNRTSSGGNTSWVNGNQYTNTPAWFRLSRSGNTFTASASDDGSTWFTVGTSTVSMGNTYYVGLAVSSGTSGTVVSIGFDHVTK